MTTRRCLLLLALAALLAALPAPAQGPDEDEPHAVAQQVEAQPAQGEGQEPGGRSRTQPLMALLLLLLPAVGGGIVVARTGLSVTIAALFPGFTDRSRRWVLERPALCFANGLFLGLVAFLLIVALGQAGDGGQLLAVLLLLLTVSLTLLGSVGVCEVVGQRVYELLPHAEPSRLARVIAGTVALVLALLVPPCWPLIPFVLAIALGACRLGLKEPAKPQPVATEV